MRVGLYSDHLYGGDEIGTGTSKYIHYLTRELRALGVDVIPLHKGENPADVDLLHDPSPPWNAPLRPRRPLVVTIHDLATVTYPEYFEWWVRFLYIQKLRWIVHRSRRVLVDSRRTREVVQSTFRPKAPLDLVPLGLEERFQILREERPDPPFLVQVGIHRSIKDPWSTLKAFEEIADRIPHELHFIGKRIALNKPLEDHAAAIPKLAGRVKFLWSGEASLPSIYNRTSLVIHPCPEEGFGFVPLEALACGAHVLARAPAVREVLGPFGCYYTAPGDLPQAILTCLRQGPNGTAEDRAAHARSFSFRRMAEQTLVTYEAALRPGHAGTTPSRAEAQTR